MKQSTSAVTWPIVAIVLIGTAGFLGVMWLADPQSRSAVVTAVVGGVGAVVAGMLGRLHTKVDRVEHQTNGTTQKLLDKIPDAERPDTRS